MKYNMEIFAAFL